MASSESSASPNSCSILLVEDNSINQKVVVLMLGKYGITPAVVSNGEDAVKAAGESEFDLILMDLHMPGMGGIEAATKIREMLGDTCPPIVALTADAVKGNAQSVLEQGMDGFLTKPVSSDTLRNCILEHTERRI